MVKTPKLSEEEAETLKRTERLGKEEICPAFRKPIYHV